MFLLFGSAKTYYAAGGWHDMLGAFSTLPEAIEAGKSWRVRDSWMDDEEFSEIEPIEWWHVVDLATTKIVAKSLNQAHGAPGGD